MPARLGACGHAPSSLQTLWTAAGLGGYPAENPLNVAPKAVLVARSADTCFGPTNPAAIVHLNPAAGEIVADCPIEARNCVAIAHRFLVGCRDYFCGGVPVAYDTWKRARVL